jgi:GMP synthase (glutamine-hydrolysing)
MRAVVFEHDEDAGLGLLGPALQQAGFTLVKRFRTARREDVDAELVVVMGGHMGAYEADQHPFLREEMALLSERLANERPCLGAQMLAAAAGAEVFLGKNGLEVGALPVRWTQEGLKDPVIAGVRPRTVMPHWHQDTFKPVPGATLLASTDRYSQQAFRLGKSYGFQFHLELSVQLLHILDVLGERGARLLQPALEVRGVQLEVELEGIGLAEPERLLGVAVGGGQERGAGHGLEGVLVPVGHDGAGAHASDYRILEAVLGPPHGEGADLHAVLAEEHLRASGGGEHLGAQTDAQAGAIVGEPLGE